MVAAAAKSRSRVGSVAGAQSLNGSTTGGQAMGEVPSTSDRWSMEADSRSAAQELKDRKKRNEGKPMVKNRRSMNRHSLFLALDDRRGSV